MWQVGRGGGGFHGGGRSFGGGGFRHGGGWNRGGGRWRRPWNWGGWGGYPFYYPAVYQPYYPTTYYYPQDSDSSMLDLASVAARITSAFSGEVVDDKLKEKLNSLYPGVSFLVTEHLVPGASTPYTILLFVDSDKKLLDAKVG